MRHLRRIELSALLLVAASAAVVLACRTGGSTDSSGGFEPQVTSIADDFHFHWSDLRNYTGTRQYTWVNNGTQANVTQSSVGLTATDSVKLIIRNPAGTEVYRGDLRTLGGFQTPATGSGSYTIRVEIRNASGTIDCRVQRTA